MGAVNTRNVTVHVVHSFAKTEGGGNPAGVVLQANQLSACEMAVIARQAGFSETVFLRQLAKADYELRYFTPNTEIDLCGHATIAAFHFLRHQGLLAKPRYSVTTKSGVLQIETPAAGPVYMEQPLPVFYETLDQHEVCSCLNLAAGDLTDGLPIQIVSTGVKDIFVPVKTLHTLLSIQPDFAAIIRLSKRHQVVGLHVFAEETLSGSTAHCRNFAPLYDIPEESATGTSNGALSCYLYEYGRVTPEQAPKLVFEQGYSMNKPSEIAASMAIHNNRITRLQVGGSALLSGEVQVQLLSQQ